MSSYFGHQLKAGQRTVTFDDGSVRDIVIDGHRVVCLGDWAWDPFMCLACGERVNPTKWHEEHKQPERSEGMSARDYLALSLSAPSMPPRCPMEALDE